MAIVAPAYLIVVGVISLVSFIAYWLDKRRAANGGRRVSERTLHLLAFLGGWPGALIGQRQFRHKTQKVSFRIIFWLVVAVHIGIVSAVAGATINISGDHEHGGPGGAGGGGACEDSPPTELGPNNPATWSALSDGFAAQTRIAAPATSGVEKDVPLDQP